MGDPWGLRRTNREKLDSRWNSEDEVDEKWTSDPCPSERGWGMGVGEVQAAADHTIEEWIKSPEPRII